MASKKKLKEATLEALLERASQSKNDQIQYKDYESEALEMTLKVKKIPARKFAVLSDGLGGDSLAEEFDKEVELIYECVPMFHSKELQDAYECAEPTDVVMKVFDENVGELERMITFLLDLYGLGEAQQIEDLKN